MTIRNLLVIGGGGQLAAATALAASNEGHHVTSLGRRPFEELPSQISGAFRQNDIRYIQGNIRSSEGRDRRNLHREFERHDWVVNAAEPYRLATNDLPQAIRDNGSLLDLLIMAGFTSKDGKKYVRVGSPVVETLPDGQARDFGTARTILNPSFRLPYYRVKMAARLQLKQAVELWGMAGLSVTPTGLIGPYSDHGSYEIIPLALKGQVPFLPDVPTNAVSLDHAARGILRALEAGKPGAIYQLAGQDISMAALLKSFFDCAGIESPPILPVPALRTASLGASILHRGAGLLGYKDLPTWANPLFPALLEGMGHRSSLPAETEISYDPGDFGDLARSVEEALKWFRETGQYTPPKKSSISIPARPLETPFLSSHPQTHEIEIHTGEKLALPFKSVLDVMAVSGLASLRGLRSALRDKSAEPAAILPGLGLLMLIGIDFKATNIEPEPATHPYKEFIIATLGHKKSDQPESEMPKFTRNEATWGDILLGLKDRFSLIPIHMVVTDPLATTAGQDIGGFPKYLGVMQMNTVIPSLSVGFDTPGDLLTFSDSPESMALPAASLAFSARILTPDGHDGNLHARGAFQTRRVGRQSRLKLQRDPVHYLLESTKFKPRALTIGRGVNFVMMPTSAAILGSALAVK